MVSSAYAHRLKSGLGWTSPSGTMLVDATDLTAFVQPLPIPVKERVGGERPLDVDIVRGEHVHHPDLGPGPAWTYRTAANTHPDAGGRVRPIVVVAERRDAATVTWRNRLEPGPDDTQLLPPFIDLGVMTSGVAGHVGMDPYATGTCSTHLHGAELGWLSDGHPVRVAGVQTVVAPGADQHCEYPNGQLGTTLWFHDHVMGSTTGNVYAGLVGMYLLRTEDETALELPGHDDPDDGFVREMPLILGDRSFAADGRVIYGASFSALAPKDVDPARPGHLSDQASEFKGDCITVNGAVWPYLEVEPRRYRFRVVNAAASRFFRLVLRAGDSAEAFSESPPPLPVTQIGGDGGFLPEPYRSTDEGVVLAPGERADLVVDFARCPDTQPVLRTEIFAESDNADGYTTVLEGNGGDRTFEAVPDGTPDSAARPLAVARVMQFRVGSRPAEDDSSAREIDEVALTEITEGLADLDVAAAGPAAVVRPLALDEQDRGAEPARPEIVGPALVGALSWYTPRSAPAEVVADGDVEVWEFTNVSPDTHPIHLHLVQFRVLSRRNLPGNTGPTNVAANECGWKDTLRVGTGQVTRFVVRFANGRGRYVWHCHILEHEDMGMMRPLIVQQAGDQGGNP